MRRVGFIATSIGDQVVSGLSNLLLVVLLARSMDPAGFGFAMVAYSGVALLMVASRSFFGVAISVAAGNDNEVRREAGSAFVTLVALSPLGAAVIGAIPLLGGGPPAAMWLLFGLAAWAGVLQDCCRFALIALNRPAIALLGDLSWLAILLGSLVIDIFAQATPLTHIASWGAGALVATAMMAPRAMVWTSPLKAFRSLRLSMRLRGDLLVAAVSNSTAVLLSALIIARFAGPAVSGSLAAAGQLMAPINMAVALFNFVLLPYASQRSEVWSLKAYALVSGGLMLASAVWISLLLLIPGALGIALLGESWGQARAILPVTGISYVFVLAGAGAASLLVRFRMTRVMARLRLAHSAIRVVANTIVSLVLPNAGALAATDLALNLGFAGAAWRRAGRLGRGGTTSDADPTRS